MSLKPTATDVLVIVDLQYDFLPGGALAVADGDAVIAPINALSSRFSHVVLTQDWHPPGHASFASSHKGRSPYDVVDLHYGRQILWPDHCVQGSRGAEITRALDTAGTQLVLRKGHHKGVDSYSAFVEADRTTRTGLAGYLRERGLTRLFVAGLATDFCVSWTALDAIAAGFEAIVVEDACRAIDTQGSLARAISDMTSRGVRLATAGDVLA